MLLDGLLGNETAEKVLLYLAVNNEAYAQELANRLGLALSTVQTQLQRLERRGILVSRARGRMRFYTFNPRFPLMHDVRALLLRALEFLPDAERAVFAPVRRRPRAAGKPL
jgi:DNA-binding transcriptional ArsR family regulator